MASEKIRYRTKRLLADALKEVIQSGSKQLDQITIADIVRQCGVSRKAFYYHFEDIYDLTRWTLEEDWNSIRGDADDDLRASFQKLIDYSRNNRAFCLSVLNSSQSFRIEDLFTEGVTSIVLSRLEQQDPWSEKSRREMQLIAECSCVSITAILTKWLLEQIDCTADELIDCIRETVVPVSFIL